MGPLFTHVYIRLPIGSFQMVIGKFCPAFQYMGVSKNRGTPKWMVKIMENPIKMG